VTHPDRAQAHWDERYRGADASSVSWYEPEPRLSLAMFDLSGTDLTESVIDIGGGASSFAESLVDRGLTDITVLDVSEVALSIARGRMGHPESVHWLTADVTTWSPGRTWDFWHDRAVFHFLTEPEQRASYRALIQRSIPSGGAIAVATFADDGPEQCSGLPVERYSVERLFSEIGDGFTEIASGRFVHTTPSGAVQPLTWIVARKG
jgi:hypothetical protein